MLHCVSSITSDHFFYFYVLVLVFAVATAGLFGWGGDDTQGCGLPSEVGKWSCSCLCISPEHHTNDPF